MTVARANAGFVLHLRSLERTFSMDLTAEIAAATEDLWTEPSLPLGSVRGDRKSVV